MMLSVVGVRRLCTARSMRIGKRLAAAGVASRRASEEVVRDGRVVINGDVVDNPAVNVKLSDVVLVDGVKLPRPRPARMWLCHKLPGELVTRQDPDNRPTLFSRLATMGIPEHNAMIAVGRLDFKSEGLLLLTNSGDLARYMELPATGLPRTYRVRVYGKVTPHVLSSLARGVKHQGTQYRSVTATVTGSNGTNNWLEVTLKEGKNREVRKLMSVFGLSVNRLIRTAFGPYTLGRLERGAVMEVKVDPRLQSGAFGTTPDTAPKKKPKRPQSGRHK